MWCSVSDKILISKARKVRNGAIVFPGYKKSTLRLKHCGLYDNFCDFVTMVIAAILNFLYDTVHVMMLCRGIVCLSHPLVPKTCGLVK